MPIAAEVAGPPFPVKELTPLPAQIEIILPIIEILRTVRLPRSVTNIFPVLSPLIPCGEFNEPEVASPPSPELAAAPLPTSVVICKKRSGNETIVGTVVVGNGVGILGRTLGRKDGVLGRMVGMAVGIGVGLKLTEHP